jgi:dihydrofolate reductase
MSKKILAVLLFGCVILTSCNNYKLIKNEDVKTAFILNSSATFKGYFYKGSDDEYHYFVSKWDLQKDHYFKISASELSINKIYEFNDEGNEIRIDVFNEHTEVFGSNKFYTLYLSNEN